MRRRVGLVSLIACGAAIAASPAPAAASPKYATETCTRVALIDASTGNPVRGAEDLAVDAGRNRLIVSAHDRRAVAKAVAKGAESPPEGGVYAVSFDDLRAGSAQAEPLVAADAVAGGLRPHGVVYDPQTDEIAFINRGYEKNDGRYRLQSRLERVSAQGGTATGNAADAHCAANDLVAPADGLLVTFDHGACNWRRGLEDAFLLRRSGVSDERGETLFDAASYANGIADLGGGELALAATREKALLILEGSGDLKEVRRVALPGGPDNLTLSGDAVVAAVHPSTMRLAAALKFGLGKAPSRVVKVDPSTDAVTLLFDDPSGKVFAGATVAVEHNGALILGSATDEGLLVCTGASPSGT